MKRVPQATHFIVLFTFAVCFASSCSTSAKQDKVISTSHLFTTNNATNTPLQRKQTAEKLIVQFHGCKAHW